MNTVIKIVVNNAIALGMQVVGFRRGFQGLIENDYENLTNKSTENIANLGGCYLQVSRSEEFKTPQGVIKGAQVIGKHNLVALIVVGGNGTFCGARDLIKHGIKVIAIPATIDNDLFYTERTLGFDTAVNNAVRAIDNIRQTMEANSRAAIFEVMGRECGDIALAVAVAVQAHAVGLRETNSQVDNIINDVRHCLTSGATKSPIVIISEAVNFETHQVVKQLSEKLNIECRDIKLGYLQRGGAPSVLDRTIATQMAVASVNLIKNGKFNLALGVKNNRIFFIELEKALLVKQDFNLELLHQLKSLYNL